MTDSDGRDGDTRLAEIAARAATATPGPWTPELLNPGWVLAPAEAIFENMIFRSGLPTLDEAVKAQQRADGEFAAAAREDVPWLLAEVERLRAENETLREGVMQALHEAERPAVMRWALDETENERDTALARLAEVAARHQPYPLDDRALCRHCGREWPCADAVTAGETG